MARTTCRVTYLFVLTFYVSFINCNWIIEQIPNRQYRPRAMAQSRKKLEKDMIDLSRGIWLSSTGEIFGRSAESENSIYSQISKADVKDYLNRVKVKDVPERECKPIKTLPPNAGIPCGLRRSQTPMFVYFSFDDATTSWNIEFYRRLFGSGRHNPNGCPIRATFFNSHDNTEYNLLAELYATGHEVASHSVSHRGPSTWWSVNATKEDWLSEIGGQRDNIHKQTAGRLRGSRGLRLRQGRGGAGIPKAEVKGMRAPFLAIGGDTQFKMLEEEGFLYDSSIPNNDAEPSWPFTLHDPTAMNGPICRGPYCPTSPHASIWEVVMNVYYLGQAGKSLPCSMVDGCRPSGGKEGALEFLRENFLRHYDSDRKVPFGINMHAAWFAFEGYVDGMDAFIREILAYDDVYIVPIIDLLEWIQNPRSLKDLNKSQFGCSKRK